MPRNHTKQRSILLSFLSEHTDEMLSAAEIVSELQTCGISRSAVYRNLSMLEQEGSIRKQTKSGAREIYYQFLGSDSCKGCLHLQCTKCGKTVHMKHRNTEMLVNSLIKNDDFNLNMTDTILYGLCKNCR